ncbi:MAG: tetratricopeptide repeat protein, partial [Planctomycetes bacterium]|nr:tetratricopeptide repeat protein [Planctomycetota bacterium]
AAQMALAELYRREGQNVKADAEYADVYDKLQQKYLDDSSNLGTNYLLARAAMGAGEYDGAVLAYERVLTAKPDLDRVRMDLAAAYIKLDAKAMAELEFQTIVNDTPDDSLRQDAQAWLDSMHGADQKHLLFGSLSTAYVRDSNPRSDPVSTRIPTTTGVYYLDEDLAHEKVDYANYYSAVLRHIYKTPLEPLDWRTTFIWFGSHYHHLDSEDGNYYSIKSGPGASIGNWDFELSGLLNAYEEDWQTYSKGHGAEVTIRYLLNDHVMLGWAYKLENKKLYQDRNTDARNHSLSFLPAVIWGKDGKNLLSFDINYQAEYNQSGGDYREAVEMTRLRDTFHSMGGEVRYSRKLGWGLKPHVRYGFREVRYTARNSLFEEPREDHVHTYEAGITKELPRNFSVDLTHTRIRAYSNSPVDDYRRNLTGISVKKVF